MNDPLNCSKDSSPQNHFTRHSRNFLVHLGLSRLIYKPSNIFPSKISILLGHRKEVLLCLQTDPLSV